MNGTRSLPHWTRERPLDGPRVMVLLELLERRGEISLCRSSSTRKEWAARGFTLDERDRLLGLLEEEGEIKFLCDPARDLLLAEKVA
jgi:hypothetical protein